MIDTNPASIVVIEDDQNLRELLCEELQAMGHEILSATNLHEARQHIQLTTPEILVCDLRLPDGNGIDLLEEIRANPQTSTLGFIVITGFGSIEQAVDALKKQADDFLTKPLNLEHLRLSVHRVLENIRLRRRLSGYETLHGRESFHGMLGRSLPMQQLYKNIEKAAATNSAVLVRGESGTGKELVARALHASSARASGPFIAVNSAGIPGDLLESEFFGHVRGAFSGAESTRTGLIQAAHGGTLFLDEIGEMPLALQAKLLRVLEDGLVRPVGSDHESKIDVRIVAATHRDLEQDVAAKQFREDLFYRIETVSLNIPPLRERGEDIERLAVAFLSAAARHQGRPSIPTFTAETIQLIHEYDWPGNVRELANAIESAVIFASTESIGPRDLPTRMHHTRTELAPTNQSEDLALLSLAELEAQHINRVLTAVAGNRRRAAEILSIGRRTLYRKIIE